MAKKPVHTALMRSPDDPLLSYEVPVWVVVHVTDRRAKGGGVTPAPIGRSDWFGEEEAREHALEESLKYPPPNRFVVLDPDSITRAIYQSGSEVPLFVAENVVDDTLTLHPQQKMPEGWRLLSVRPGSPYQRWAVSPYGKRVLIDLDDSALLIESEQDLIETLEAEIEYRDAGRHARNPARKPKRVKAVYDTGPGGPLDRYTVVMLGRGPTPRYREALGLSDDPDWPHGVSLWQEVVEGPHLGKKIAWSRLPAEVQAHVVRRLAE